MGYLQNFASQACHAVGSDKNLPVNPLEDAVSVTKFTRSTFPRAENQFSKSFSLLFSYGNLTKHATNSILK